MHSQFLGESGRKPYGNQFNQFMSTSSGNNPADQVRRADSIRAQAGGDPTHPNASFAGPFLPPPDTAAAELPWTGEIPAQSRRAGKKFSDMIESFSEVRTFAYARAKKDGFWLTCRNAFAQEGMEPVLNLAPVLPCLLYTSPSPRD